VLVDEPPVDHSLIVAELWSVNRLPAPRRATVVFVRGVHSILTNVRRRFAAVAARHSGVRVLRGHA